MNTNDFIFSNKLRHRISRHAAFWLAYWIFFLLSFYIPFGVFPEWNTGKFSANVKRVGGIVNWLELRWLNSSIAFIPLVAFTYVIIYFVLPRYFFNKKNRIITTALLILVLIPILLTQYFGYLLVVQNNYHAGPRGVIPDPGFAINKLLKMVLSNYFVVAGLAVIIKLLKRWHLKQQETEQLSKEKTKAELQLLKARIHPHFLFNSLNNIYSFSLEASPKTPEMIQKLSGLLHYMLHECNQPRVPLEKELKMIQDYIALEKIRYGERLKLNIHIQQNAPAQKGEMGRELIAPLLLIPFVENSFKHGSSKMLVNPEVSLDIYVDKGILYFKLVNSRPLDTEKIPLNGNRGLGLKNVRKRLALLYPNRHELQIAEEPATYTVWMKITLEESGTATKKANIKKEKTVYELA